MKFNYAVIFLVFLALHFTEKYHQIKEEKV